jgi:hypothetical protein
MLEVRPYGAPDADAWDELVARAPMATFLHTRRFLSHHGDRFEDASLIVVEGGAPVGALPAAVDPEDATRVSSHPGVTYGGIVHDGTLSGERMVEALGAVTAHYTDMGFRTFVYKAVPHIYHRVPSGDDLYALFRHEGRLTRMDLSVAIDLECRREPSGRRQRGRKKAQARGLEVAEGAELAEELWPVLERNLADRHGLRPVHTLEEIGLLAQLFPDNVRFVAGALDGDVVAGVVLFTSPRVFHAQYTAAGEEGRAAGALDVVFEHCLALALTAGVRYFDFGVSTVSEGRDLNAGLYRFKVEFGGGGVVHQFYTVDCAPAAP